ncbi:hypothetical protein SDC9_89780 [bioreactor metagenome]|uniref:Uncharacterized protein n=1 Tax=bioreactor metagenome TaxID=1076179 RepID=A0A644ZQS0_9ZZZZ
MEVNTFIRLRIVNTNGYLMAGHSCHGITYVVVCTHSCGNVDQRILCHHAFIHAVKCQQTTFRTPERSFADAKLIAVYRLSANNSFFFFSHSSGAAIGSSNVQIVV